MNNEEKSTVLSVKGLTKWENYWRVFLERINFEVKKGQSVLLWESKECGIGELFSVIAGLKEPDEGTVEIAGQAGFVPEEFPYLEIMDVAEYMKLPLVMKGKSRAAAGRIAEPVLENSVLWDKCRMVPEYLNNFRKYCLLLYMAQTLQPDILVVANVRKYMSGEEEQNFWKIVGELVKEQNMALLCLADRPDIPLDFDCILRLSEGKLLEKTGC